MGVADAIETGSVALVSGLMMGAISFLFFFLVLRAGLIHVGLALKGMSSILLLPVAVILALGWKIFVAGEAPLVDRILPGLILFLPPVALAIASSIPLSRLTADLKAADSAGLSHWSAAAALPYGGAWYGILTFYHLSLTA
ncbi:hypothetical protein [Maricaulis sp.]|uniref:hypothetical protein n=1 Tax=Maricaulis sp. TaxID=1486257 RepID=UPI003297D9C7